MDSLIRGMRPDAQYVSMITYQTPKYSLRILVATSSTLNALNNGSKALVHVLIAAQQSDLQIHHQLHLQGGRTRELALNMVHEFDPLHIRASWMGTKEASPLQAGQRPLLVVRTDETVEYYNHFPFCGKRFSGAHHFFEPSIGVRDARSKALTLLFLFYLHLLRRVLAPCLFSFIPTS